MKSEELIRSLAAEMAPVRRLPKVGLRVLLWAGFALMCLWIGIRGLGVRADLAGKLREPSFLLDATSLFVVFALSAWSAFSSSIPGRENRSLVRILPFVGLLVWVLPIVAGYSHEVNELLVVSVFSPSGMACVWRMTGLALIPTMSLFCMLRKAAPLEHGWTGSFALLAASSLAMLGTQMLCAKDEPSHVLIWHVAPVAIAAIAGIALGKAFLGRSRLRADIARFRPARREC